MSVTIDLRGRDIPDVRIQIQALWIAELRIRHRRGLGCPIRRDESSQPIRVVAGSEVIEIGFAIAFFAGTT